MIKHPWASLAGYNIPKIYLLSYLHTSLKKILIKHDYDVHEAVTQNCEFRVFCCLIFSGSSYWVPKDFVAIANQ